MSDKARFGKRSGHLPFPAQELLTDQSVRLAIARKDYEAIAALVLMACAGWTSRESNGSFPADKERIAAATGLPAEVVERALTFWQSEGWMTVEGASVYLPWVTAAAAERAATSAANSARAATAAKARWSRPVVGQKMLVASSEHATSKKGNGKAVVRVESKAVEAEVVSPEPYGLVEPDGWPKQFTKWACDVWNAHNGAGSAPGGEIAGHFGVLRRAQAPWPEVQESWERYVQFTEPKFLSPGAWRKRWRQHLADAPDYDQGTLDLARSYDKGMRRGDFEPVGEALRKRE